MLLCVSPYQCRVTRSLRQPSRSRAATFADAVDDADGDWVLLANVPEGGWWCSTCREASHLASSAGT